MSKIVQLFINFEWGENWKTLPLAIHAVNIQTVGYYFIHMNWVTEPLWCKPKSNMFQHHLLPKLVYAKLTFTPQWENEPHHSINVITLLCSVEVILSAYTRGLDWCNAISNSMLIDKYFLTWLLIGWWLCWQTISHRAWSFTWRFLSNADPGTSDDNFCNKNGELWDEYILYCGIYEMGLKSSNARCTEGTYLGHLCLCKTL